MLSCTLFLLGLALLYMQSLLGAYALDLIPCRLLVCAIEKELISCNTTSKEYGHSKGKWPQAG